MITIIRQVTKIFTLLDYYQEYRKDFKEDVTMRLPLYSSIIQLFFKKCKNHVLEGNIIVLPIGKFKVCQIVRDMSKKVKIFVDKLEYLLHYLIKMKKSKKLFLL